jgi:hypothetical protein
MRHNYFCVTSVVSNHGALLWFSAVLEYKFLVVSGVWL